MKKLFLIPVIVYLLLTFLFPIQQVLPITWTEEGGGSVTAGIASKLIDCDDYDTFADAITAIGANERTLLISQEKAVSADVTVPSNVTLWFIPDGSLAIATGEVVTINGQIPPGFNHIFSGAGTVAIGSGSMKQIYPQWWGMLETATAAINTAAIQAAIDSVTAITLKPTIFIAEGTYSVTANSLKILSTQNKTKIVGEGKNTVLKINGTGKILHIYAASPGRPADIVIENLSFDGTTKGTNYGLYIERGLNCHVSNIWGANLTAIVRTSYAKQCIIDGLYTSHNASTVNVDYLIYDNGDGVAGLTPTTEDLVLTKIYGCADITDIHLEQVDGLTLDNSVLFQHQATTGRLYNVYMRESHFINISNVHAYGSGSHGIYFVDCWKFNLSNIDCAFNGSEALGSGIRIEDSTGTGEQSGYGTISNIFIDKVSKHGIEIINSTRLAISNATIYAVSSTYKVDLGQIRVYDGINISGTGSSRITLSNIYVDGVFSAVVYTRYGVRAETGTNYINCTGSVITNCFTGDISLGGNKSYYEINLLYAVTTTDAAPTVAWNETLNDNTAYKIEAEVVAKRGNIVADRAIYERVALVYRASAGAATIQGATVAPVTVESNAAWDCDITVSVNDAQVTVTGAAGVSIYWQVKIKVQVD